MVIWFLEEKSLASKISHQRQKSPPSYPNIFLYSFKLPYPKSVVCYFFSLMLNTIIKFLIVTDPSVKDNCISRKTILFFFLKGAFQPLLSGLSFQWYLAFLDLLGCLALISLAWYRKLLISLPQTASTLNVCGLDVRREASPKIMLVFGQTFLSSSGPGTYKNVQVLPIS